MKTIPSQIGRVNEHSMTSNHPKLAVVALIAALSQAAGRAESPAQNAAAASATAETKSQSFLRLDGTDLHIGDLPPITFHGFASQGFLSRGGKEE